MLKNYKFLVWVFFLIINVEMFKVVVGECIYG